DGRLLVAAGPGGGEPPCEVPAAVPPAVDRGAVARWRRGSAAHSAARTTTAIRAPVAPIKGAPTSATEQEAEHSKTGADHGQGRRGPEAEHPLEDVRTDLVQVGTQLTLHLLELRIGLG